jgi:hypothetical protein
VIEAQTSRVLHARSAGKAFGGSIYVCGASNHGSLLRIKCGEQKAPLKITNGSLPYLRLVTSRYRVVGTLFGQERNPSTYPGLYTKSEDRLHACSIICYCAWYGVCVCGQVMLFRRGNDMAFPLPSFRVGLGRWPWTKPPVASQSLGAEGCSLLHSVTRGNVGCGWDLHRLNVKNQTTSGDAPSPRPSRCAYLSTHVHAPLTMHARLELQLFVLSSNSSLRSLRAGGCGCHDATHRISTPAAVWRFPGLGQGHSRA